MADHRATPKVQGTGKDNTLPLITTDVEKCVQNFFNGGSVSVWSLKTPRVQFECLSSSLVQFFRQKGIYQFNSAVLAVYQFNNAARVKLQTQIQIVVNCWHDLQYLKIKKQVINAVTSNLKSS